MNCIVTVDKLGRVKLGSEFLKNKNIELPMYFRVDIKDNKIILNEFAIVPGKCQVETVLKDGKTMKKFVLKTTEYIRAVDEMGRIVLPVEYREKLDINEKDELLVQTIDNEIIFTKNIKERKQ